MRTAAGASMTERRNASGMTSPTPGDLLVLNYPTVRVFRGRLRALMSLGGVGRRAAYGRKDGEEGRERDGSEQDVQQDECRRTAAVGEARLVQ
jgi:hypothetical protein